MPRKLDDGIRVNLTKKEVALVRRLSNSTKISISMLVTNCMTSEDTIPGLAKLIKERDNEQ